jgi:hypothetical protein
MMRERLIACGCFFALLSMIWIGSAVIESNRRPLSRKERQRRFEWKQNVNRYVNIFDTKQEARDLDKEYADMVREAIERDKAKAH